MLPVRAENAGTLPSVAYVIHAAMDAREMFPAGMVLSEGFSGVPSRKHGREK